MRLPSWAAEYVGVPYERMDCYALVRSVFSGQLGVVLPAVIVPETDLARRDAISRHRSGNWEQVERGTEQRFDVAELALPVRDAGRWRFLLVHLGVVVERGLLLHSLPPNGSHIRRYGPSSMMPERFWRWQG